MSKIGVLLVNLGTPKQPSPKAIRTYLVEFLLDPLVVKLPRLLWLIILYSFILPFRPKRLTKLYQSIWLPQGSPLLIYSQSLAFKLQQQLGNSYQVELAMRYGEPNIITRLDNLKNCSVILTIPLFPQYSSTTTESIIQRVKHLAIKHEMPPLSFIKTYAQEPLYITALANSIKQSWRQTDNKSSHLLISFHSIPTSYTEQGDPYLEECRKTIAALIKYLNLNSNQYTLCFQSRFSKAKWQGPYTDKVLIKLAQSGITDVTIICPGFAVDCLETLEEINIRYKKLFINSGGKNLQYLPALNDSKEHVELLYHLINLFPRLPLESKN